MIAGDLRPVDVTGYPLAAIGGHEADTFGVLVEVGASPLGVRLRIDVHPGQPATVFDVGPETRVALDRITLLAIARGRRPVEGGSPQLEERRRAQAVADLALMGVDVAARPVARHDGARA